MEVFLEEIGGEAKRVLFLIQPFFSEPKAFSYQSLAASQLLQHLGLQDIRDKGRNH